LLNTVEICRRVQEGFSLARARRREGGDDDETEDEEAAQEGLALEAQLLALSVLANCAEDDVRQQRLEQQQNSRDQENHAALGEQRRSDRRFGRRPRPRLHLPRRETLRGGLVDQHGFNCYAKET
jgi:hypothetical protein